MAALGEFMRNWNDESDFIIAHTSGSTGTPKPIKLLKSDMLRSARATNEFFGIIATSTLGIPLSVDYIAGKMMVVRSVAAGCDLEVMTPSNIVRPTKFIDLLSVVPSQIDSILDHDTTMARVGCLLVGGAALGEDLRRRINQKSIKAFIGYGMTETCSHVALRDLSDDSGVYQAMPDITFDTDHRGCLVINSCDFSWQQLVTNDVVELIDDRHFRWLGRADNIINSGGIKICPESVEQYIAQEAAQHQLPMFYITSVKDDKWGNTVALMVEGDDITALYFKQILDSIQWPKGWKPRRIIARRQFERTASGKIKREKI